LLRNVDLGPIGSSKYQVFRPPDDPVLPRTWNSEPYAEKQAVNFVADPMPGDAQVAGSKIPIANLPIYLQYAAASQTADRAIPILLLRSFPSCLLADLLREFPGRYWKETGTEISGKHNLF
jgi:hypothetical protein